MHRTKLLLPVSLVASACASSGVSPETARILQANAASATAAANEISREGDPLDRAAQCNVFISIARNTGSSEIGGSAAEMARASVAYRAFIERQLEGSADQLLASTGAILLPAEGTARDRAARWCIENVSANVSWTTQE